MAVTAKELWDEINNDPGLKLRTSNLGFESAESKSANDWEGFYSVSYMPYRGNIGEAEFEEVKEQKLLPEPS